MALRLFAAFAALFLLVPANAQTLPTEADLRRHIEILASDDFEGRQPGTAGEALAVSYIAAALSNAGLLPGYRGNYFQPVALISRADGSVTLRSDGPAGARTHGGEMLALGTRERITLDNLPLTFVGYAIDIGEDDGGAMGALRFDGQAVLLLGGAPEGAGTTPSYRRRIAFFRERGAAAIIVIVEPDLPWDAAVTGMRFRQTYLASHRLAPVEAILSTPTADAILSDIGQSRETLAATAAAPGFASVTLDLAVGFDVTTIIDRYDGINVVARLPGTGETDETVLFSAHHDHFGICRPDSDEDRICNGAVDNASGTAALIETARALAQGAPPVRDILFLTTTAEEDGLLGARAFVAQPPVPLDTIVAVFNLDTIAIAPAGAAVGIIGRGMTPLDTLIDAVAAENGRTIDTSTDINGFVRRNDGWAFLEQGVPAVMAGGSFTDPELLNAFLRGPYHGPDDEIEDLELGGALEDTWLHIALGRAFSDPARYPSPRR
ncbi:M28 family peptidase [Parasphingopyxis algicola]|uniref:M28 family peptidase n=1 Tax=Parasphingopyxis algicola TaxID=2026624 RepID=UPI0015A27BCB|nr:M28 family peptidase [Parasphingopyxis algicola]QLC24115.1 M28 family peptidase [Parasphingopyxis algicola]